MSTSAGLLQRGAALYRSGEFVGALRAFERHVDAHPRSAEGWLGVARALFRLREVEGALAACDRALAITPAFGAAMAFRERMAAIRSVEPAPSGLAGRISPEVTAFLGALIEVVLMG